MKAGVKKLLRTGMMPARAWGIHAVGMSPTERLQLTRQMAAAAGKKVRPSCLCSWKHTALKRREELSTMAPSIGQKEFGLENGGTNEKKRGCGKFKKFRRGNR